MILRLKVERLGERKTREHVKERKSVMYNTAVVWHLQQCFTWASGNKTPQNHLSHTRMELKNHVVSVCLHKNSSKWWIVCKSILTFTIYGINIRSDQGFLLFMGLGCAEMCTFSCCSPFIKTIFSCAWLHVRFPRPKGVSVASQSSLLQHVEDNHHFNILNHV